MGKYIRNLYITSSEQNNKNIPSIEKDDEEVYNKKKQEWLKGLTPIRFRFFDMLSRIKASLCRAKLNDSEKTYLLGYERICNNLDIIAIL